MILRSLLWALGLFILYCLLVAFAGPRVERRADNFFVSHQEWQKANIARAQNFVKTDLAGQDVYLGSSLSNNMNEALLPRPFHELSLIGGGPLTGLLLLEKGGQRPRRVFIESNYALTRFPDTVLLDKSTGFPMGILCRFVPAFRFVNRPANSLFITLFSAPPQPELSDEAWEERRQELLAGPLALDETPVDPERIRKMIETWEIEFAYQAEPESGPLLEILLQTVRALELRGIEIIFYHMPIDDAVSSTGIYRRHQDVLAEHFPEDRYRWIQPEPDFSYRTVDGFHLAGPSGDAYTRHLLAQLPKGR